jgi:hypothetical protein
VYAPMQQWLQQLRPEKKRKQLKSSAWVRRSCVACMCVRAHAAAAHLPLRFPSSRNLHFPLVLKLFSIVHLPHARRAVLQRASASNVGPAPIFAFVRHAFDLPLPSTVLNTHAWIPPLAQHKTPIQALLLRHYVKSVDESSMRAGSAADEHRPSPRVTVGDSPRFSRGMLRALCKSEQRHTAKRERVGEAQLRRVHVRARACSRRSPAAPLRFQSPSSRSVDHQKTLLYSQPSTSVTRSPPTRSRLQRRQNLHSCPCLTHV